MVPYSALGFLMLLIVGVAVYSFNNIDIMKAKQKNALTSDMETFYSTVQVGQDIQQIAKITTEQVIIENSIGTYSSPVDIDSKWSNDDEFNSWKYDIKTEIEEQTKENIYKFYAGGNQTILQRRYYNPVTVYDFSKFLDTSKNDVNVTADMDEFTKEGEQKKLALKVNFGDKGIINAKNRYTGNTLSVDTGTVVTSDLRPFTMADSVYNFTKIFKTNCENPSRFSECRDTVDEIAWYIWGIEEVLGLFEANTKHNIKYATDERVTYSLTHMIIAYKEQQHFGTFDYIHTTIEVLRPWMGEEEGSQEFVGTLKSALNAGAVDGAISMMNSGILANELAKLSWVINDNTIKSVAYINNSIVNSDNFPGDYLPDEYTGEDAVTRLEKAYDVGALTDVYNRLDILESDLLSAKERIDFDTGWYNRIDGARGDTTTEYSQFRDDVPAAKALLGDAHRDLRNVRGTVENLEGILDKKKCENTLACQLWFGGDNGTRGTQGLKGMDGVLPAKEQEIADILVNINEIYDAVKEMEYDEDDDSRGITYRYNYIIKELDTAKNNLQNAKTYYNQYWDCVDLTYAGSVPCGYWDVSCKSCEPCPLPENEGDGNGDGGEGGASLVYETPVRVFNGIEPIDIPIGEFVENLEGYLSCSNPSRRARYFDVSNLNYSVLSFNSSHGLEYKKITRSVKYNYTGTILTIILEDGGNISVTGDHILYRDHRFRIPASDLMVGDRISILDSKNKMGLSKVADIRAFNVSSRYVYDLSVDVNHNFPAGNGTFIFVHNGGCDSCDKSACECGGGGIADIRCTGKSVFSDRYNSYMSHAINNLKNARDNVPLLQSEITTWFDTRPMGYTEVMDRRIPAIIGYPDRPSQEPFESTTPPYSIFDFYYNHHTFTNGTTYAKRFNATLGISGSFDGGGLGSVKILKSGMSYTVGNTAQEEFTDYGTAYMHAAFSGLNGAFNPPDEEIDYGEAKAALEEMKADGFFDFLLGLLDLIQDLLNSAGDIKMAIAALQDTRITSKFPNLREDFYTTLPLPPWNLTENNRGFSVVHDIRLRADNHPIVLEFKLPIVGKIKIEFPPQDGVSPPPGLSVPIPFTPISIYGWGFDVMRSQEGTGSTEYDDNGAVPEKSTLWLIDYKNNANIAPLVEMKVSDVDVPVPIFVHKPVMYKYEFTAAAYKNKDDNYRISKELREKLPPVIIVALAPFVTQFQGWEEPPDIGNPIQVDVFFDNDIDFGTDDPVMLYKEYKSNAITYARIKGDPGTEIKYRMYHSGGDISMGLEGGEIDSNGYYNIEIRGLDLDSDHLDHYGRTILGADVYASTKNGFKDSNNLKELKNNVQGEDHFRIVVIKSDHDGINIDMSSTNTGQDRYTITLSNNKRYGVNVTLSAEDCSFWKQDAGGSAYIKGIWSGFVPGNGATDVEAIIPSGGTVILNVNVPKKVVDTLNQRGEEVELKTSITIS